MSLINGLVDRHPVNVVHMCAVHRGAEESTPALQQHCGDSFLRVWRAREGGWGEGERAEKREWNSEALGSAVVKGGEWERRPCSQPHGPFSLRIMEAFLWFLTPLSHAGNGQPSTHRSQQTRSDTLTHWIIEFYTQESHPLRWPGSRYTWPWQELSQDQHHIQEKSLTFFPLAMLEAWMAILVSYHFGPN